MKHKKIYTVISVLILLILLYLKGRFIYFNFHVLNRIDTLSYVRMLPDFAGIAGVVLFYSSGFKKTNLLRWFMCLVVFSLPFNVWYYILYFTSERTYFDTASKVTPLLISGMLITLVLAACCDIGLWLLSKEKTVKLTFAVHDGKPVREFRPASRGARFVNRLTDIIVMLFIVISNLYTFVFLFKTSFNPRSYQGLFLTELFFLVVYYLLLEGIFNTSPGKCITNTVIVNENGERPRFSQIAGRTFARLIPFEAFSFFGAGARGWHDTLSNTYVVAAANKEEEAINEIILDAEQNLVQ
jgi:uncharacterized RDD family membrane protein YckC